MEWYGGDSIDIHYIKGIRDLPESAKQVILFVLDNESKIGYRVETGCYHEEKIVWINGEMHIKPCFLYGFDLTLEIDGVFAWSEFPQINLKEVR